MWIHAFTLILKIKSSKNPPCLSLQEFSEPIHYFKNVKWNKEKQMLYTNANMRNPEKWNKWSYLQSRNRDTEVENECMATRGKEVGGRDREPGVDRPHCLCRERGSWEAAPHSTGSSTWCSAGAGWEGRSDAGKTGTRVADSCCRTVKTNTTRQSSYTPIKIN